MSRNPNFVFICFLLILLFNSVTFTQNVIIYKLNPKSILSFTCSISPDSNSFSLSLKLNDEETKKIAVLTKENIGNYLKIILHNQNILETVIKGEINNGRITINEIKSRNKMMKILKLLLK